MVIQSFVCNHEVNEGDLRGNFRQIMWIPVLGRDVERELVRIFDSLISQLDKSARSFLISLFQKNGVKSRIELLANILQKDRLSELNSILEGSQIVGIRKLDNIDFLFGIHFLDPLVRLTLRIDAEGPPPGLKDDDTIFT